MNTVPPCITEKNCLQLLKGDFENQLKTIVEEKILCQLPHDALLHKIEYFFLHKMEYFIFIYI